MIIPQRPEAVTVQLPDGKTYKIELDVQIYRAKELEPRTDEEKAMAKKDGLMYRILWCPATYDMAVKHAKDVVRRGKPAHRVELVRAERDELQAFRDGNFVFTEVESGG